MNKIKQIFREADVDVGETRGKTFPACRRTQLSHASLLYVVYDQLSFCTAPPCRSPAPFLILVIKLIFRFSLEFPLFSYHVLNFNYHYLFIVYLLYLLSACSFSYDHDVLHFGFEFR